MTSADLLLTRPSPTPRELRGDLYLAAVILVGAILSAALSAISGIYGDEQAPFALALVYAVALAVPLAVRRRWPATVAVIVSVAYFAAVTLRIPEVYVGNIAMFIALYTVGAWSADRRRALIVRVAIIVGMFAWLIVVMYRDAITHADDADVMAGAFSPFVAQVLLGILVNALYFGGAYYFGERAWSSAVQRATLEQRTAELEREREVTAAQAVALDRVRIARELHDVVAHHVSVMGVQAGAARVVLDSDPEASRRMLAGIEMSAREAIDELHRLLDTLRTPGAGDDAPASTIGLDSLPALAAASDAAGLPTTFTVVGAPVAVPQVTQVNLYRIAQEALTNARRHGGTGANAEVRLRYTDDRLVELEVVNSGRPVREPRPGLGQLGMRERAAASGGAIEIGARDRGGFRVRVAVPLDAVALGTAR
ncbi:Signal transduction histidine kinase [Microbacterium sp. cf046]|uniref:sensor histidine kinase n=1 Tax=Microbacterium sp. cf046 TaxID=1761803 RepID=UPI0008E4A70F|nr:histidine kinase [Microbacterium sp. cf046]SFR86275.1 Signal transduction histidine kinase [Microbacterium sp. cf046]